LFPSLFAPNADAPAFLVYFESAEERFDANTALGAALMRLAARQPKIF
jgi:hypothetical protein